LSNAAVETGMHNPRTSPVALNSVRTRSALTSCAHIAGSATPNASADGNIKILKRFERINEPTACSNGASWRRN